MPFSADTAAAVARARQHSIGDLLRRTAQRSPDKLAVIYGDERYTFAEFDAAVNRAAGALAARGLRKGDRLALLGRNSWSFAVLVFATAKLGVVLVPINFMLNAEEIAFILGHCGASAMVVDDALTPTAEKAMGDTALKVLGGISGAGGGGESTPPGWEDVRDWWSTGPADDP